MSTLDAPDETLPLEPGSLDLVLSLLTLHEANDVPGALIQMKRALKPDGLMLAMMPGGETLKELRFALTQAETEIYGGASPRVLPFADVRAAGALLQRTGFALPVTDVETLTVRYDNLFALMRDLARHGGAECAERTDRAARFPGGFSSARRKCMRRISAMRTVGCGRRFSLCRFPAGRRTLRSRSR